MVTCITVSVPHDRRFGPSSVLLLFIQISKTIIDFIIYCLFNYEIGPSLNLSSVITLIITLFVQSINVH